MNRVNQTNKTDFDELDDIFDEKEYEALEEELSYYLVKFPDEHKIDATIETLRQYVPDRKRQSPSVMERLVVIIKRAGTEITLVSKTYWIASTILFLLGYFIANQPNNDPLLTVVFLAPLPFIFGLLEVFKGREHGLLEMELSCKFSAHEIILSRLFLIGVYNVTLNTVLTLSISSVTGRPLVEMLLKWFTPFTFFVAIALWLSMKFKGQVFVTTFLTLWLVLTVLVLSNNHWVAAFLNASLVLHLVFLGLGILLIGLQVRQLIKNYAIYEGGARFEVNY
ncbi:hypothetical protein BKP45_00485 [Anaerobacillus alkalidiazotrophicus]|uniref:Uncharacterized protein n=1 Tax=Anaerobacillus alkalidiazotrophicus TaxID=472963 RepID=A0A1S2MC87_9BACI|nr:hypothetical protein [Anaerobacillus alkalidiazotrophicus]OIJ21295.1 hypothetical protein BKP45_00485 [Anaerobacillus alkalidiazotrophicus]